MNDRELKLAQWLISFYQQSIVQASSIYSDPAVQRSWAAGRLIRIISKIASQDSQAYSQVIRAINHCDLG